MEYARFEEQAREILDETCEILSKEGRLPYTIFVITPSDEVRETRVVQTFPEKLRRVVQETVQILEGTAAVVSAEVWLAPNDDKPGSPAEHPDRQEVAIVSAVHPHGVFAWIIPMFRDGESVTLGKIERIDGSNILGLDVDVLKR